MLKEKQIVRDERIEGEIFKVRVETTHDTAQYGTVRACTAVHSQQFARRIGGVRFVTGPPPEDRVELGELASAMTWKCALAGLPADGEKTVVYCSDVQKEEELPAPQDAGAILAEHLAVLTAADSGVVFGPDMHCGEDVMTLLAHEHGYGDHVSGLKEREGGLSIDGHGYTASGLESALVTTANKLGWKLAGMRASIQGFGAVGAHTARNLSGHGVIIVAVSSAWGALVATGPEGLPIEQLFETWHTENDEAFQRYETSQPRGSRWVSREAVFTEPAEIFIPAARVDVLATDKELERLPAAFDIARFAEATGVKVVLEGANHPLTVDAEQYLAGRGVYVLPDYLVNCGGLIGCWMDWLYREKLEGEQSTATFSRLNEGALHLIRDVVRQNMGAAFDTMEQGSYRLREAVKRLSHSRRAELLGRVSELAADPTKGRSPRSLELELFETILERASGR